MPWPRVGDWLERISKSNALYPLLIALCLSVAFAGTVIAFVPNVLIQVIVCIPVLMIVFQIVRSFEYFSKNNPDMLRTETHVIQQRVLEMMGDESGVVHATAADLVAITNPANTQDRIENHG